MREQETENDDIASKRTTEQLMPEIHFLRKKIDKNYFDNSK